MANSTFTLDDIRAAADQKYGATKIAIGEGDIVELRNYIRLDKDERAALKAYQEEKAPENETDEELFERLSGLIRILVSEQERASHLLNALQGKVDLLAEVIAKYMEDQKSGKAEPSQD